MPDQPSTFRVAAIGGDGIGPEVVEAAMPVIDAAADHCNAAIHWESLPYGADHFLATGETLPESAFEHLRDDFNAIFLGALGDPRVPSSEHARDILLGLRFRLDLYINFRPCALLHPDLCPLKDPPDGGRTIDLVIFRENTEGLYLGRARAQNVGEPNEEQVAEEVHTAPKVGRILRAALEWASAHGRSLVTMTDKSNAIPVHRLWGRLFDRIGEEYPEITKEHRYVDALAMELVRAPERFQIIVTNNLLGDILSDLGAELVGGMGLAASANLHPGRPGLFEPVHGSAPTLVGRRVANPMASILTGALMLDRLGLPAGAAKVRAAVRDAVAASVCTPDLRGSASTGDVAEWIRAHVAGS